MAFQGLAMLAAASGGGGTAAVAAAPALGPLGIATVGLAIGGSILGGISANKQAKKQNRAIAEAAKVNIASVDKNMRQNALGFVDATEIASRQAQAAHGRARNLVGFDSGLSTTQYFAAAMADAEADQMIRRSNFDAQQEAFQLQKESISRQAKAGMVSPGAATIQGAISGAQTGLGLGGALQDLAASAQAASIADQQAALLGDQRQLLGLQIQGAQQQLSFQRDLNLWQSQNFGAALDMRKALGRSPFSGSTYFDWAFGSSGFNSTNPILPYAGGR